MGHYWQPGTPKPSPDVMRLIQEYAVMRPNETPEWATELLEEAAPGPPAPPGNWTSATEEEEVQPKPREWSSRGRRHVCRACARREWGPVRRGQAASPSPGLLPTSPFARADAKCLPPDGEGGEAGCVSATTAATLTSHMSSPLSRSHLGSASPLLVASYKVMSQRQLMPLSHLKENPWRGDGSQA